MRSGARKLSEYQKALKHAENAKKPKFHHLDIGLRERAASAKNGTAKRTKTGRFR